ncbi:MAG: YlbF family regulator, partial [Bacilli bacterium]
MDWTDVYMRTNDLADSIVQSEVFATYKSTKSAMQACKEAGECIAAFNRMKDQYEEVMRFGKYHPDYLTIRKQMSETKRALDLQPKIAAFKKAERELERTLQAISGI